MGNLSETTERPISLKEAMEHLGVGRVTIYEYLKKKNLPSHKVGGRRKFYRSELNRWIQNH
jgi:excisionase family DNA binding protein